jgi:hypothetical protein
MKTKLALAILMGTVALAAGQTIPPTLDAIAETPTSITVLLTAGSEPIYGFDVYCHAQRSNRLVAHFRPGAYCPRIYSLQPGQNIAVIMGIETNGDICRQDSSITGLNCGTRYYLFAVPHGGGTATNIADGETTECSP